jgi:iron complex outermembrane receptor protein
MPRQDNLTSTGTYALAKNIAAVTTTGFETDLQFQHQWQQHQLIVNGGILWLDSKTSEAKPSFYLSSHARFMSNFNLQYVYKNVAISLTGIYKFRNPQQGNALIAPVSQDYFLLNGRISYAILKNKLQVFVQADNIFDQYYSDLLGAVMPGRWLQAGVRWQWVRS